jgi:tRNA pseudouridine55 synthase
VADVGTALGCGAHLTRLIRTRIGHFSLGDSVPLDGVGEPLPVERAVAHLPAFAVGEEEARAARHGRCLAPSGMDGPYALLDPESRLIGVWRDTGAKSCPEVVLPPLSD